MKSPLLLPALVSCFFLSSCCGSPPPNPPVRKVTVIGTAIIKVAPDQMLWSVQVSINDGSLAAAKAVHDTSLKTALDYVKSLGDSVKNLQTAGIRFDKQSYFNQGEDRSKPYTCSTQFTFTLTDFDKYGAICDEFAKLNGLEIQSIDYAYSKQSDVRREALKQALQNAHDKAGDLAATANCTLGAPLEIIEGGGFTPRPMMDNAMMRAQSNGTPNAVAGQIIIDGTINATYELGPK